MTGRKFVVLEVDSCFPPMRVALNALLRQLERLGACTHILNWIDPYQREILAVWSICYPDMFLRVEESQNNRYLFDEIETIIGNPAYSYAYKHEVCTFTDRNLTLVARLLAFFNEVPAESCVVSGIHQEVSALYQAYTGKPIPGKTVVHSVDMKVERLALVLLVTLYSVLRSIWVTRLWLRSRQRFTVGSDIVSDDNLHLNILVELSEDPKDVLLVLRNSEEFSISDQWKEASAAQRVQLDTGNLSVRDLIQVIPMVVRSEWRFWRGLSNLPTQLFAQIIKFPSRSIAFRAFLNSFEFEIFFGKDDYNSYHIIRTEELRRAGVRAIGINHGLPVPEGLQPAWRYIDFDVYYTFGRDLFESYYCHSWPSNMKVVPVGSYGLKRSQIHDLSSPRPKDIVVYLSTVPENDEILRFVDSIARHFDDRTIYIKHKRSRPKGHRNNRSGNIIHVKGLAFDWTPPSNVIEVNTNSYELALRARYALTTRNTTITAEAIQFGMITFVIDPDVGSRWSYWSRYPSLCLRSAAEFISWVEKIESNSVSYPWPEFDDLIDRSGKVIFDIISDELRA